MAEIIKEETTNHPEGATISLSKCETKRKAGGSTFHTELSARSENATVKMRVQDVQTHNLRTYLDLCVKQIDRERSKLTEKPSMGWPTPQDFKMFVHEMAYQDMFIFNALTEAPSKTNGKQRKQRQRKPRATNVTGNKEVSPTNGEIPF